MRTRWIALATALASAATFALSSIEAWWTAGEVAIGPFGTHHCFGGDCRSTGLQWLGGSDFWMRTGVATRAAALIATTLLVLLAGALAARRVPRLVARTTLIALACALATGGYFIAKIPAIGSLAYGIGPVFYGAGLVTGLAAAVLVLRLQPAGDREDHEDQDDQARRAEASSAPASITETAAEQSKHE